MWAAPQTRQRVIGETGEQLIGKLAHLELDFLRGNIPRIRGQHGLIFPLGAAARQHEHTEDERKVLQKSQHGMPPDTKKSLCLTPSSCLSAFAGKT
jgi:hypothetical protein